MATRIKAGLRAMPYGHWQTQVVSGVSRLMTEYDIAVLWLPDVQVAAEIVVGLYVKNTTPVKAPESVQPQRVYSDLRLGVLMAIPGISTGLSERLLVYFGDIRVVSQATVKELSNVEGIGKKKAQMIHRVMTSEDKVEF
jgi:ERCC4-type nuclease